MSLDCEGEGAPCVECGEFDLLPYACPWCRGTFCAAHATCHHVPAHGARTAADVAFALPLSRAAVSSSAPLCAPPQGPPSPRTEGDATPTPGTSSGRPQHRCAVCQSALCALAPCPECGDSYCAAHRFHGHNDLKPRARAPGRASQRAISFGRQQGSGGTNEFDPAAALCAPFTPARPLVLAPVGYRSGRMGVLAFIVAPATVPAGTFTGTSVGGSEATGYTIGVCSLVVATEMSVGQLRDRLVGFLRDASVPLMEQRLAQNCEVAEWMVPSGWSEWVSTARSCLLSVAAAAPDTSSAAAVGPASRRVPALSLVELPVGVILRKAPIVNATVALHLSDAKEECTTPGENGALRLLLATVLFGSAASPSAPSSSATATTSGHRDDRVKALATRLYLQHQQVLCRTAVGAAERGAGTTDAACDTAERGSARPSEDGSGPSARGIGALMEPVPDPEGEHTPSPVTVSNAVDSAIPVPLAAVWPFRHAPPLNSFDFFNGKLSPCGTAAIRPAAAPRVVVAVFVADAALPVAVMPMCIAISRDWPLARVVHHLREEVGELQLAQHRDARIAISTFSLYRLGSGSGTSSAAAGTAAGLSCLWSGQAQPFTLSTPVTLQNADVLLLCPESAPAAERALREELQRLQGLTGRAKAALRADMVKKCAVM
ncbi:hypothetical protein LSCM1_05263 [Leishmania martiniquensis]|uniref:C2H2-type domain-containing protein n=1 Tax=Leishmania martiniquensis TaxID=1580590 RepID=A0A836KND8_9TRYP|nr:hypothetical protein LSCM1_05263 [Leishmania martiniquensis]